MVGRIIGGWIRNNQAPLRLDHNIYKQQGLMKINKVNERLMFLSPTVQAGWEPQSYKMDFENIANLGQGSYGVVWKAKHKKSGAIYAIKQIKKKSLKTQKLLNHVRTEVKIMYELNHPNITKLYNHFEDDFSIYFVLEYAQNGQLFAALCKSPKKKMEENRAAHFIWQLAKALQYIHKKNIIHRDIKPENILIAKNDQLKLADFGWSNFTEGKNKRETYCGTLDYLAPEMVSKDHLHDYRVDIWSMGVLIYELCTGSSPFSSPLFAKSNISEDDVKKNISTLNYAIPKELSEQCRDLISKILILKPQDRISLDEILKHPWIQKIAAQEDQQLVQNENWETKLKNQYGNILDTNDEEIKKYEVFSNEQIYSYSRIESIINANKKKIQEQSDKKVKELRLKVEELEKKTKRQEEQIKFLRTIQVEHQNCTLEATKTKDQNKRLNKKIDTMSFQMQEYERIIREYQKSSKR